MSTKDLTSKVFTFDKEVSLKNDVTKTDGYEKIHAVIKNLLCMREIDVEFIPKFKFF